MFERFTKQARQVVKSAVDIAARQGSGKVGPEHLLVALSGVPDGPVREVLSELGATPATLAAAASGEQDDAALLARLGIDLEEVRRSVERNFGEGTWARRSIRKGHIPFTPEAKKALELSLRHALALKSKSLEVEHVLLGVLDAGPTVRKTLNVISVEPGQVKRRLLAVLKAAG
ncbi:MAG TPA: Clp protease N-terminal domain-containing protein [Actinomycetota bacterium]|nr:Clp protease N-terminal domain-containing protein [Actinomycetota bacterium]